MPGKWELNAVLLNHTNRFFSAATMVVLTWQDPEEDLVAALMSLSGNMLWAKSSFEAGTREEERAMAYTGAFIASVVDKVVDGTRGPMGTRARALSLVADLERGFLEAYDRQLSLLLHQLPRDLSVGRVNEVVWERLFPGYPYRSSQGELCRLIRERLTGQ